MIFTGNRLAHQKWAIAANQTNVFRKLSQTYARASANGVAERKLDAFMPRYRAQMGASTEPVEYRVFICRR
ncbi:hypothetical protein K9N68_32440 [Kovacikia minuta CCNUW1]|uniref:hypothetical protein n=1 Tax=Kovacikia minuta TaxID=2931930 RepID=UPI001CCCFF5A|nr:hypothetical protein [Kovacikia minuta]UBF26177.1 hypothetical protein K9N68_32440 [Kovacikia minuta CCNUW1]